MGKNICSKITSHKKHYLIAATSVFCLATNVLFVTANDVSVEFFCLRGFCFQAAVLSVLASVRCCREDFSVRLRSEGPLHVARALVGCGAYAFMLKAAQMIDMDDIMNISTCSPALVALLACVFLREKLSWGELTTYLSTIGGVMTLCQPSVFFESDDDDGDEVQGSLWALAGSFCMACTYVTQRMIRKTPVVLTLLSNAVVSVAVLLPLVLYTGTWKTADCFSFLMLTVSSVVVVVGNVYQVEVSKVDVKSRLAVLCAVDVPFIVVAEILNFEELPWWACYAASGVVTACVAAVVLLQKRERRKERDKRRKEEEDKRRTAEAGSRARATGNVALDRWMSTVRALTAAAAKGPAVPDCATKAEAERVPSHLVENYLLSPVRETVV